MKTIKLQSGFLVNGWDGNIKEVNYFKTSYLHYGNIEERFVIFIRNNIMLEPINKYNSDKIFDTLKEAEKFSNSKKQERIEYYKKEIQEYTKKLNQFLNEKNN